MIPGLSGIVTRWRLSNLDFYWLHREHSFDFRKLENLIVSLFTGVPWTEEEHRMFLLGLQKLGKGDWRGIARNYVVSRTPTQVASHAQKYFIRQTNVSRRKRRSSLFDIIADDVSSFFLCPMHKHISTNEFVCLHSDTSIHAQN